MLIKQQRVQNGREPILQWESPIPFCPWGSSVHPTEPLLPFYSAHHGNGFTPVLLAGHTIGRMTHTMLLSKLQEAPSAGSALLAPLRQFSSLLQGAQLSQVAAGTVGARGLSYSNK